jgi:hypothetical protein
MLAPFCPPRVVGALIAPGGPVREENKVAAAVILYAADDGNVRRVGLNPPAD